MEIRLLSIVAFTAMLTTPVLADEPIRVCVKGDGSMRMMSNPPGFPQTPRVACKVGEREMKFATWEADIDEAPGEDPDVAALRGRVETLERRIGKLDSELGETRNIAQAERNRLHARIVELEGKVAEKSNDARAGAKIAARVQAPFEVVGRDGKAILRVSDSVPRASGGGARVTIASSSTSGYGVRIYNAGDQLIGGLVESSAGGAIVAVMDGAGQLAGNMNGGSRNISVFGPAGDALAGMSAGQRGGTVAVYNGGKPIAYLTQATTGAGGNVTTLQNNGGQAFSAGATPSGGGEACVNRVTANGARGACLGIALPGGMSQ